MEIVHMTAKAKNQLVYSILKFTSKNRSGSSMGPKDFCASISSNFAFKYSPSASGGSILMEIGSPGLYPLHIFFPFKISNSQTRGPVFEFNTLVPVPKLTLTDIRSGL